MELDEFNKDLMGAKANNTKRVVGNLPDWVYYPESFGIPFNVMEYFLTLPENSEISKKIDLELEAINTSKKINIAERLSLCQKLILKMKFVENELTKIIKNRIISFGIKSDVKLLKIINNILLVLNIIFYFFIVLFLIFYYFKYSYLIKRSLKILGLR